MCFSNMFGYQTQYFLFGQFLILSEHSPEISPMTLLSFSYQGHLVRSVLGTDHTTRVSCRGTTFSDKHTTRIILMQSCIPLLYHYYPKICPILSGKAIHIYICITDVISQHIHISPRDPGVAPRRWWATWLFAAALPLGLWGRAGRDSKCGI